MPVARKHLISVPDTPYYHVVSRCVRRAFLCGEDKLTGKSYEHRRAWIEDRIRLLSSVFAVDLCAYAVMSNHYHLVVKLIPDSVANWADNEVLERWCTLFKGPLLVQRYRAGESFSDAETNTLRATIAVYRQRLASLSWFMKCLNEPIARKANAEDHCRGHFWEARFGSFALRTEQALLTCMAYVDLNPVRAGIAQTAKDSMYTSIRQRLTGSHNFKKAVASLLKTKELQRFDLPVKPLLPFGDRKESTNATLPMGWEDYHQLIDDTARLLQLGQRKPIRPLSRSTLQRLKLSGEEWLRACTSFNYRHRKLTAATA